MHFLFLQNRIQMAHLFSQLNWTHSFTKQFPPDTLIEKTDATETKSKQKLTTAQLVGQSKIPRNVPGYYMSVEPDKHPQSILLLLSSSSLQCLSLPADISPSNDLNNILSGNLLLPTCNYHALNYGGHQFGIWNGQLGDGRQISFGEIENKKTKRKWSLGLKGCGKTAFSRHGDGLCTLKSTIKEYLGSEYLMALGIPTYRVISLHFSGKMVQREDEMNHVIEMGPGGLLTRMAPSFIRFGTFELFYMRQEDTQLKLLVDYVIQTHYPELLPRTTFLKNQYTLFFERIVKDTALLTAHWQAAGFVHGVLNTDELSIHGMTCHLGPFAFLDDYEPQFAPNVTGEYFYIY